MAPDETPLARNQPVEATSRRPDAEGPSFSQCLAEATGTSHDPLRAGLDGAAAQRLAVDGARVTQTSFDVIAGPRCGRSAGLTGQNSSPAPPAARTRDLGRTLRRPVLPSTGAHVTSNSGDGATVTSPGGKQVLMSEPAIRAPSNHDRLIPTLRASAS